MTVSEMIAKVNESLQDSTIAPTLSEVNDAVAHIAAQMWLPELLVTNTVKFTTSTDTITGATNAEPIVLATATDHGLATGDLVVVTEVVGNTAANGRWYVEVLSSTTLRLLTSEGNGDYVSGGVITKSDASVDMPSDFCHALLEAFSISQNKFIAIRSNLRVLSKLSSAYERLNSDRIEELALEGNTLYCMPYGTTDDILLLKYYRKPAVMTDTTETPSCIPDHLQESIIVQYLLSKKWPLIEDDIDGATPNTGRATKLLGEGIAKLLSYYPRPSITQPKIERNIQYF